MRFTGFGRAKLRCVLAAATVIASAQLQTAGVDGDRESLIQRLI